MTLVKYNPSLPSLGGWMDDFFDNDFLQGLDWSRSGRSNSGVPAVNIKDNPDSYELEVAAPGLEKKDFEVTVDNGALTISAKKEQHAENNGSNYSRKEFSACCS